MSLTPETLCPAPPHFQRFAWQGIPLLLPEDWNLHLHRGAARAGFLVFADLHSPRLELRWQTPRRFFLRQDPTLRLRNTTRLLQKRNPDLGITPSSAHARIILCHPDRLLLAADAARLYELRYLAPLPESETLQTITTDFLHHLAQTSPPPREHLWCVYGAAGLVPASAKLQKVSLLPGAVTLTFKHSGGEITLGSFSMADRLLAQSGSLRNWATSALPLIARFPKGSWQESPTETLFLAPARRRFRSARHTLTLRPDAAANRLTWTHHFSPL